MGLEFTDERLSAYLDGELPPDERATFEQMLTDSPQQQQVLAELTLLRGELQQLPQLRLGDDFTRRVVAAAIAAQAEEATAPAVANPAPSGRRRNAWNTPWVAIPALAAALLVAVLVVQRQWQGRDVPQPRIVVAPDPISTIRGALAELRRSSLGPDEAVVVRLRIPRAALLNYGVEAALVKSGIEFGRPDQAASARRAGSSYRQQVRRQLAGKSTSPAAVASEALFIEAPLEQVEATLAELASRRSAQANFRLEMIVSTKLPASEQAEGEGGSRAAPPLPAARGPVAHRLEAQAFPLLPEAPAGGAGRTTEADVPLDLKRPVRVLMLIEATE
jgi:hypothetical protein